MTNFNLNEVKYKNDAPHFAWHQVWTMALTKPSTETYETLLADPEADHNRAFRWIFIMGTLAFIGQMIANSTLPGYINYGNSALTGSLLCVVVFGGPIMLLSFVIGYGLIQWVAKRLEGTGSYGDFYYATA